MTVARFPVRSGTLYKRSHTGSGPTQLPTQWDNFWRVKRQLTTYLQLGHIKKTALNLTCFSPQVCLASCFFQYKVSFVPTQYKR